MMNEFHDPISSSNVLLEESAPSVTAPDPPGREGRGDLYNVFSPEEVQAILIDFQPLIRRIAGAMVSKNPSSLDIEDLTSAGTMGLLSALRRFDPTREIKFRTFAEYRIRGMMLDEIRAMDWVPRSVRSRQEQIRQTANDHWQKTGTSPTTVELAESLGIDVEELEGLSGCEPRLVSLDEPVGNGEEGFTLGEILPDAEEQNPFRNCADAEMKDLLKAALVTLPLRQREVLRLYYHAGLTMKEIGGHMGLTESGVCRVHSSALRQLRLVFQEIETGQTESVRPKNLRKGTKRGPRPVSRIP
jgi:RNA polymerase sigma factor FliA